MSLRYPMSYNDSSSIIDGRKPHVPLRVDTGRYPRKTTDLPQANWIAFSSDKSSAIFIFPTTCQRKTERNATFVYKQMAT